MQATTEVPVENATLQDNALDKGIGSTPEKNIFSRTMDRIIPKPALTETQILASPEYKQLIAAGFTGPEAVSKLTPGLFSRYGPMLAAGTGVMALTGGFDQKNPKVEGGIDTNRYPR